MNRIPNVEDMKLRGKIFTKEMRTVKNGTVKITNTECQIIMQKIEQ